MDEKSKEEKTKVTVKAGSDQEDEGESSRGKRRKVEGDTIAEAPTTSKQRVTSKGKNVPAPVETFQELRERYECPNLILANLEKNGWKTPTGIQGHGIPMLFEVRVHICITVIFPY